MSTAIRAIVSAVVLLVANAGMAGYYYPMPVYVDVANRTAFGSLYGARRAPNTREIILCGVDGGPGSAAVLCQAVSAINNAGVICRTTAPQLVNIARAVSSTSYVYFRWDTSGTCTYLYVNNSSQYLP